PPRQHQQARLRRHHRGGGRRPSHGRDDRSCPGAPHRPHGVARHPTAPSRVRGLSVGRERIDQLLVAWEERLRPVDENLVALEGEPTYQIPATGAGGKRAPLDGVTKTRVYPVLDALGELFEHRERLTEVLERAKEIRESISSLAFWNTDEKLAEI